LHKHRPEIFHRDIKAANILFGADGMAKVADFGLACVSKCYGSRQRAVEVRSGTPGYTDPKYSHTGIVTEANEVFSFGMVMIELLTCRAPAVYASDRRSLLYLRDELRLDQDGAKDRIKHWLDGRARWPPGIAAALTSLALLCIHDDVDRRPSFLDLTKILQDLILTQDAPNGGSGVDSIMVHRSVLCQRRAPSPVLRAQAFLANPLPMPVHQAQPVFATPTPSLLPQQLLVNPPWHYHAGDSGAGPALQQMMPASPPLSPPVVQSGIHLRFHPGQTGQILSDASSPGQMVLDGTKLMDRTYFRPPVQFFNGQQSAAQLHQFAPVQDGQGIHHVGAPVRRGVQAPLRHFGSLAVSIV